MRCSTKEMRLVYRDFLLQANQENKQITVLEADLSSSMSMYWHQNLENVILI